MDGAELIALVAVAGSLIAIGIGLRRTQTYQARACDGIEWSFQAARNAGFRRIRFLAPTRRGRGMGELRPDFRREVDGILADPTIEPEY